MTGNECLTTQPKRLVVAVWRTALSALTFAVDRVEWNVDRCVCVWKLLNDRCYEERENAQESISFWNFVRVSQLPMNHWTEHAYALSPAETLSLYHISLVFCKFFFQSVLKIIHHRNEYQIKSNPFLNVWKYFKEIFFSSWIVLKIVFGRFERCILFNVHSLKFSAFEVDAM